MSESTIKAQAEANFKKYAVTECFQEPPIETQELAIGYAAHFAQKVADEQTADLRNRLEAYKWRRVEEELPIEDGEYLAAIKSPSWSELIYAVIEWKDSNWIRHSNVVAWMPVPPFKELQEATKDE